MKLKENIPLQEAENGSGCAARAGNQDGALPRLFQEGMDINLINHANQFLFCALNIGEQMLLCGAEVGRVEDSVRRICKAYGAERTDVFTITSSIVVTVYGERFGVVTQTRRISGMKQDFTKLDQLNALSRAICSEHLPVEEVDRRYQEILKGRGYPLPALVLVYGVVSAAFSLFFGGSAMDAAVSAVIGMLLKGAEQLWDRLSLNSFIAALGSSFLGGLCAIAAVRMGIGNSVDKISIGNIMLLIPGITLTNSIRDMFGGDTISGALKFFEALLLSVTVAFGFVFARVLL